MFTSDFYAEVSKSNDKASYTIKKSKRQFLKMKIKLMLYRILLRITIGTI